jgi:hypothetical protein
MGQPANQSGCFFICESSSATTIPIMIFGTWPIKFVIVQFWWHIGVRHNIWRLLQRIALERSTVRIECAWSNQFGMESQWLILLCRGTPMVRGNQPPYLFHSNDNNSKYYYPRQGILRCCTVGAVGHVGVGRGNVLADSTGTCENTVEVSSGKATGAQPTKRGGVPRQIHQLMGSKCVCSPRRTTHIHPKSIWQ